MCVLFVFDYTVLMELSVRVCLCVCEGRSVLGDSGVSLVMSLIPGGRQQTKRSERGTHRIGKKREKGEGSVTSKSEHGLGTH